MKAVSDPRQLRYCFMFYPSRAHDPTMKKIAEEEKECDPYQTLRDLWSEIPWPEQDNSCRGGAKGRSQGTQPQGLAILDEKLVPETEMLHRIRRDEETLDFSPFPRLPEAMVLTLLETQAAGEATQQAITQVDISGNQSVGLELVSRLLEQYPKTTVLSLLHTSPEKIPLVLLFRALCEQDVRAVELHHCDLFSAAFTSELTQSSLGSLPNYHAPPRDRQPGRPSLYYFARSLTKGLAIVSRAEICNGACSFPTTIIPTAATHPSSTPTFPYTTPS
ncbi:hypothetical protein B0H63DRAFT_443647 [Podospora didyma]|uniref:Uncharacterized protein n=1 Tax=Podospora didyma TaxID=330526 RepID=A0AAE0U7G8_9PEZI|nr:hypothetical protein B0H63DRAFT_443647 [Podospora didyma]